MTDPAKIALFALLCAIWGSTWLVIEIGYGGLGPFNVAAIRFLVAGLAFVPLAVVPKARPPSGRAEWTLVAWVGRRSSPQTTGSSTGGRRASRAGSPPCSSRSSRS